MVLNAAIRKFLINVKYLFLILFIAVFSLQLWLDYSAAIKFQAKNMAALMIMSGVTSLGLIGIWIVLGLAVWGVIMFFCRIVNPDFNAII